MDESKDKKVDESWKERYNQIVGFIKEKNYAAVLKLTELVDGVDDILFDEAKGAEYRATRIVGIMRSTQEKQEE